MENQETKKMTLREILEYAKDKGMSAAQRRSVTGLP